MNDKSEVDRYGHRVQDPGNCGRDVVCRVNCFQRGVTGGFAGSPASATTRGAFWSRPISEVSCRGPCQGERGARLARWRSNNREPGQSTSDSTRPLAVSTVVDDTGAAPNA